MNRETIERLNRINTRFYRQHADAFGRTRRSAWGGWERIFSELSPTGTLSVLDVGCGNGRLANAMAKRFGRVDYLGLDSSAQLLAEAGERLSGLPGVDARFARIDLTTELAGERLDERHFDLIAAFGLFHHLPSHDLRLALINDLAARLEPTGVLALGFWQFGAHQRFRDRFVDWESFNRQADEPIDLDQIEEHDHLLTWGDGVGAVRYCHWTTPAEVRRLLERAGLSGAELYEADGENGRLNLYALIRAA